VQCRVKILEAKQILKAFTTVENETIVFTTNLLFLDVYNYYTRTIYTNNRRFTSGIRPHPFSSLKTDWSLKVNSVYSGVRRAAHTYILLNICNILICIYYVFTSLYTEMLAESTRKNNVLLYLCILCYYSTTLWRTIIVGVMQ
jgi:hypothetical protein